MPFVKRDEEGRIVAVFHKPVEEGLEEVELADADLGDFLYQNLLDAVVRREWLESDIRLVRVLEDLVDVLIEKGVIMFQDLPEAAQAKLRKRSGFRKEFAYVQTLFAPDDSLDSDEGPGNKFL